MRRLTWDILLRWPLWAGAFQLVGTALIVWGLKGTTQTGSTIHVYSIGGPPTHKDAHKDAAIVREHPWAVKVGIWLLLIGLALQVIAAIL